MKRATLILAALLAATPAHAAVQKPGAGIEAARGVPLDRDFLIGLWTDDEDCGNVIEFQEDGHFVAANGGVGEWLLEGDSLIMTGRATATMRVVPVDRDTIEVINEDGSQGRSTRCQRPPNGEAPVVTDVI